MKEIEFVVPGKPQGKARARTFYNDRMGRMQSITPEKTVLYENLVKLCYSQVAKGESMDEGALEVDVDAVFTLPSSVPKWRKANMLAGREFPTVKPDMDNIIKVILDALNGLAYSDDKKVAVVVGQKRFGKEEQVSVHILCLTKDIGDEGGGDG